MQLLVVSPHLDDAVYSTARILAAHPGSTIHTVFAGLPPATLVTAYDVACGFPTSVDATRSRRWENERACHVLDVFHTEAHFLDGQYGEPPDETKIRTWLTPVLVGYDLVLAPLGLGHHDHRVVATATRAAASEQHIPLFLYEELPYRVVNPVEVQTVLSELRADGAVLELTRLETGPAWLKDSAVACYRSQAADSDMRACLSVPERVWSWTP